MSNTRPIIKLSKGYKERRYIVIVINRLISKRSTQMPEEIQAIKQLENWEQSQRKNILSNLY